MTRFMTAVAMACACFALAIGAAEARPKQGRIDFGVAVQCFAAAPGREVCPDRPARASAGRAGRAVDGNGNEAAVIRGGRPAGCPARFCGCEASLYVFGRIVPGLNLAANWILKFPRAAPAPGMAAARRGHVFVLIAHVDGQNWLVHDGDSGGGKTRRHVRSIAGYVVVNPNARLAAVTP